MKKLLLSMTALAALAGGIAATPAAAQQRWHQNDRDGGRYYNNRNDGWMKISDRRVNLERRIDQGIRNGSLTRAEAQRLRVRFVQLNNLESRYRRNGLSQWERRDLDQRFDALSRSIRSERHDRQDRNWRR